ncbi:MAG: hypothetical protein WA397_29580 [Roseiarcus sp.]
MPVIQDALDHGIRRVLSGDVEVCLAGEMFTQMRTSVTTQRMVGEGGSLAAMHRPVLISHPDVLEFTTRRAETAGLGDQVGSLIPGHTPTSSPSARRPQ